jgi:hypothetical protein
MRMSRQVAGHSALVLHTIKAAPGSQLDFAQGVLHSQDGVQVINGGGKIVRGGEQQGSVVERHGSQVIGRTRRVDSGGKILHRSLVIMLLRAFNTALT